MAGATRGSEAVCSFLNLVTPQWVPLTHRCCRLPPDTPDAGIDPTPLQLQGPYGTTRRNCSWDYCIKEGTCLFRSRVS